MRQDLPINPVLEPPFPIQVKATAASPILAGQLTFGQTMLPPMIQLSNLKVGKQNQPILHNLNWVIRAGEHWHVAGPAGSGKTTLLEAIVGKVRIFEGEINYPYQEDPTDLDERRTSMRLVSFTDRGKLFHSVNAIHYYQQRYNAFDADGHLTARSYLADGGFNDKNQAHLELIEQFDLTPLLETERIKLSSGQTRKLILCKSFLNRPSILLLDNPHIGLDDESRDQFNNLVDQMAHHYGTTFILSGHLRTLPRCISHQLVLGGGEIEDQGIRKNHYKTEVKSRLDISQKYALDKIKYYYLTETKAFGEGPVLEMKKAGISYADKQVLRAIDWRVNHGEKWCLVGNNGSGKSTLVGLIYGDHPQAYSNHIKLFGRRRGQGESIWDIKGKMGFTSPELHAYFPQNQLAKDVILSGFSDTLYPKKSGAKQIERSLIFLSYFNCTHLFEQLWTKLSTGEQRLILFIRALIKAPSLLLLDEPFQGLDPHITQLCKNLLDQILTHNHSMIFITHFRDEIPLSVTKELSL